MSEKNIYVRYIEGKHDNNLFIHNAVAVAAALRVSPNCFCCRCCCSSCGVPDGKTCCCGQLNLTPVLPYFSFKHDCFLCTPCQYCRIYGLDLPIVIHSR